MLVWLAAVVLSFALACFMASRFPGFTEPGILRPQNCPDAAGGALSSISIWAFVFSFVCSLFTLGMGYGTTITPLLLLLGFAPLQVVPVVLLGQFTIGAIGGFLHHRVGNVNFLRGGMHIQIATILSVCSVAGTFVAVSIATSISTRSLTAFIAIVVIAVGILLLGTIKARFGFSYVKIIFLGIVAAFNKGLSGGGYGPVVTGGQMLSGLEGKNAVGITFLAEAITCLVGVILYIIFQEDADFSLAPALILGGLFALPFSTWIVKRMSTNRLRIIIGLVVIVLGGLILLPRGG